MSLSPSPLAQYRRLEEEMTALYGAVKYSSQIGLALERISHLLSLLGNPHLAFQSIHIGGTSGKGSTAIMAGAMLRAGGYRIGVHTSPHLQIMNERHQIDGRPVATSCLADAWRALKPAVDEVRATSPFGAPSYFEAQFALSCFLFREAAVDVAVIEVGLGGRLDATNVLPAEVAVLTNVGLDHTDILGNTVEEIAADKIGIIKKNQAVVSGCTQPSVRALVQQRCQRFGARLWEMGRDLRVDYRGDGLADLLLPGQALTDVRLGLIGPVQAQNATLACAAVQSLPGMSLPEQAIRHGLENAWLAGRVEKVQERPAVILDGAHNPDKIRASLPFLTAAAARGGRVITVLGVKKGKDAAEIVPPVVQHSDEIVLTAFADKGLWQACEPERLAELVRDGDPARPRHLIPTAAAAVDYALGLVGDPARDLIWVTGSLYLVGEVRERWFPTAELLAALEHDPAESVDPEGARG